MGTLERRNPRYSEFVQAVRAYPPSQFVAKVADIAAERGGWDSKIQRGMMRPPWAVAAMVRESIVSSNEHRHGELTDRQLDRLFNMFGQAHDEYEWDFMSILHPLAYEQFLFQESTFEELSRVGPLLVAPMPAAREWPWEDVFEADLIHVIEAAFIIQGMVRAAGGRYDEAVLDMPVFSEVLTQLDASRETVRALASHLTRSIPAIRDAALAFGGDVPKHVRRHAYNPLIATPLVDTGKYGVCAPVPELILQTVMPRGLYFAGYDAWGSEFTRDLGVRVQTYVGRQFQQGQEHFEVLPEIEYEKSQLSADWILVGREAVVIVECKSGRMSMKGRLGGAELHDVTARYIEKGRTQISRTAALIESRDPAFIHIPDDRPVVGLVVTAEPFYLANVPDQNTVEGAVPTIVASLRDLERLMSLPYDDVIPALLSVVNDPERRTWQLSDAINGRFTESRRNALLDRAWASSPMAKAIARHKPGRAPLLPANVEAD